MDRDRLGEAVTELSDEEVFGRNVPLSDAARSVLAGNELSDADVFGKPPGPQVPQSGPSATPGIPANYLPPEVPPDHPQRGYFSEILHAFGQGYSDQIDDFKDLGLSDRAKDAMRRAGIFQDSGQNPVLMPFRAFAEGIMTSGAAFLDANWRRLQGLQAGVDEAGEAAVGVRPFQAAFDIGAATGFAPLRMTPPKPFVKPAEIRPVEGAPPDAPRSRVAAAQTGIPEVDSVLNSPVTAGVINNAVIDRSHTVPYMAGGSVPLEDPTVYVDKNVPKQQIAPRLSARETIVAAAFRYKGKIYQGNVHNIAVQAAADAHGMEIGEFLDKLNQESGHSETFQEFNGFLTSSGRYVDREEATKIATRAEQAIDPEEKNLAMERLKLEERPGFLGRPNIKPGEFTHKPDVTKSVTFDPAEPWAVHENIEQHTMEMLIKGGMTPEEAYRVAHFEFAEPAERAWYQAHDIDQVAAEKEQQSWLPRIQGEDADDVPENLYKKPYPHADVGAAEHESVEEAPPTPEEKARAFDIIRNAPELREPDVLGGVNTARELGVIGGDKPSVAEGTPEQAAKTATQKPNTPQTEPASDSWETRFNHFVDRLQSADDIKQLIRAAAEENENFLAARRGDISLENLAEAAGVDPAELTGRRDGLGRQLRNDDQVRFAMQIMMRTTDTAKSVARDLLSDQSEQNFIKFQESLMRRDLAVEQIVGLRAEWGRTGRVFQEFMRDVKDGQALDQFIKEKCPL